MWRRFIHTPDVPKPVSHPDNSRLLDKLSVFVDRKTSHFVHRELSKNNLNKQESKTKKKLLESRVFDQYSHRKCKVQSLVVLISTSRPSHDSLKNACCLLELVVLTLAVCSLIMLLFFYFNQKIWPSINLYIINTNSCLSSRCQGAAGTSQELSGLVVDPLRLLVCRFNPQVVSSEDSTATVYHMPKQRRMITFHHRSKIAGFPRALFTRGSSWINARHRNDRCTARAGSGKARHFESVVNDTTV